MNNDERNKIQSQKRYMVSGSLCFTSFINVESKVSLIVSGQWPIGNDDHYHREEAAWWASGEAGRVLKRAGWASEPAGRASD